MTEDFFNVFGEVWIEDRSFAGFVFVGLGTGYTLRDAAAERLGSVQDGHRMLVMLDDDFCAGTDPRQKRREVVRGFRFGDTDDMLGHRKIIHPATRHLPAKGDSEERRIRAIIFRRQ
jgi:hypothetical protein